MKTSLLKRRIKTLVVACLFLTASIACTEEKQSNTNQTGARERVVGTRGGSLSYRMSEPPTSFNPIVASREPDFIVSFYLTGGRLIEFNHDERRWVPGLAESWNVQEDGRTVVMTLRDGLKFSDGQPLTSADVEFSMRAYYGVAQSTIGSSLMVGESRIEVRAPEARRVEFVFPERVAVPESQLVNIVVLPRHVLEERLTQGTLAEAYGVTTDPKTIITAGAFAYEAVVPGERITLRRNPHYWKKDSAGTQLPYLDTLVVEIVPDADAAFTRLQEGNLDIVDRIRTTDYAAIRGQGGGRVRAEDLGPGLATDHLVFNLNEGGKANPTRRAWFKDARFRRAVSHAIDRESVAVGTLQGLATALYNFVPPSHRDWIAADVPRTEHSPERARALLSEAGFVVRGSAEAPELYDSQGNRVEFTLIVQQENEPRKLLATAILDDLAKVGIRVHATPVSGTDFSERLRKSYDYDTALFGMTVTDFDPYSYSVLLSSKGPQHQWHLQQTSPATDWEARLDELTTQLAREGNMESRRAVFREIQLLMAEQLPVVPLVARHITSAANVRVGNYRPSPVVPFSLWNVEELFVKK